MRSVNDKSLMRGVLATAVILEQAGAWATSDVSGTAIETRADGNATNMLLFGEKA